MPINVCPHCGVNNRQGSNFCNHCGTELFEFYVEQTSSNTEETPISAQEPTDDPPQADRAEATPANSQSVYPQLDNYSPPTDEPKAPSVEQSPEPKDTLPKDTNSQSVYPQLDSYSPPIDEPEASSIDQAPNLEDSELVIKPEPTVQELLSDIAEQSSITDNPLDLRPRSRSTQALITETDKGISSNIPGLLDPQTIAGENIEQVPSLKEPISPVEDLDLRRIGALMIAETHVSIDSEQIESHSPVTLHIPWVFTLLTLMLAIPIFFEFSGPTGEARELPGVAAAFEFINGLDKPVVLLLWAYDPATSGELDQAVEPVLRHLEAKRNQIVLASTLPTGPAVARRMLNKIQSTTQRTESPAYAEFGYLPGGPAILALLGQERSAARPAMLRKPSALLNSQPDLVLIAAAQAEEVQQWLEQGQPLNQAATVAITAAGADPYLRPYFDSGQLDGIVSGFDGGIAYQRLYESTIPASTAQLSGPQLRQQVYQNWGHFAIFILILLGNFSMLSNRNDVSRNNVNRDTVSRDTVSRKVEKHSVDNPQAGEHPSV